MKILLCTTAAALLLVGCDQNAGPAPEQAGAPGSASIAAPAASMPGPAAAATATGPGTALGLTTGQLQDAEVVDASGREIGEVERVIADASGVVTALGVEVEDTDPDQYVALPLEGLTALRESGDDDDWNLRTDRTREQLAALPAWTR